MRLRCEVNNRQMKMDCEKGELSERQDISAIGQLELLINLLDDGKAKAGAIS